ncbi:MAG: hypothetical protein R3320_01635 [Nitriliruptorales bacterium]|nr:hypothetical protein [Nitriliruptorales bacterium]
MLGRIIAGAIAGGLGTLAMDLVWFKRYRDGGGDEGFRDWEFATSTGSFEDASAPGQAAQKVTNAIGIDLPDASAGTATNAMHWLTGVGYGVSHSLLQNGRNPVLGGLTTGVGAFTNSYVTMGAMGIYAPIWEYDAQTLWKDLSAHLAFGLTTGLAYAAMTAGSDDNEG